MNVNRYVGQGISQFTHPGAFRRSEMGMEENEFNVTLVFQHCRHIVLSADYIAVDEGLSAAVIFASTSIDELDALSPTHLWQHDN